MYRQAHTMLVCWVAPFWADPVTVKLGTLKKGYGISLQVGTCLKVPSSRIIERVASTTESKHR